MARKKEGPGRRTQENPQQALRRWARVTAGQDPNHIAKVSITELAQYFGFSHAAVRTAALGLVAEGGSGWHGKGDSYEFRLDERRAFRKPNDTHITERVLEYMRSTKPGSHQAVRVVADAIGGGNSSVSASLNRLAEDEWLFLVKIRQGIFSYRPPSEKPTLDQPGGTLDQLAEEREKDQRQQDRYAEFRHSAARLSPSTVQLADMERARQEQVTREQAAWSGKTPDIDVTYGTGFGNDAPDYLPDGQYRELTVTSAGARLVENSKGELFELLPLRRTT